MSYTSLQLIKRLLREHIRPYWRQLAIAVGCMVVIAACTAANAWMMQPVLDQIFIEKNRAMLMIIPFAVAAVALINAAANYGNTLSMRFVGTRIIADMQTRLFRHLMISDIGLFNAQASGRLISRFTNDITLLRNAFSNVLTAVARETLSMIFLVGVMVYQNAELTLVALVAFPTAIYPIIRFGKRIRKISDKTQNAMGEFTATLDEIFSGVRTVKSYNRETFEVARAQSIIESLFGLYFKSARVQAASTPIMEILSGVTIALVIAYGGAQVLAGTTSPGAFFSFITAFLMAYKPVRALAGLNSALQEGLAAANRLFTALDTPPDIIDKPNALPLNIAQGHIRFEDVTFHYGEARGVEQVTLEVPAGRKVALVGRSGGGKSTLMNLLLRFYEVQDGGISIDGQDLRNITLHSLREAMAFVPQEPMLFDDTIKANIAYGRLGAGDDEIFAAAKNAAADEFIRALPQGYDTMVGAHGVRLSGGQRQRIAIARAMLKNAPILLLDEATSALDNESERAIQQALETLMQGRTTLMIAHRLSTIAGADRIYVVDDGRIVESGTHASLMAAGGNYAELYAQSQSPAGAHVL
jgi:subfamily B ATP-binding cassette protein MsbA